MQRSRLQLAEQFEGHPLDSPGFGPPQGLVVENPVGLHPVQSDLSAVMHFSSAAVGLVIRCGDYVNFMSSTSETSSQPFCESRCPVYVRSESVASEHYLELLGH